MLINPSADFYNYSKFHYAVKCYNTKKFNKFGKMIEKICIHNFQSHKATVIELSPKVNTLQGNSDCGKSAVLRALYWLMFNPAGDYFISDWARKGKTVSAPCEVIVNVDGHEIIRRRDKDFNGYILDGEVFEATRNSVPKKILDILRLGDVNVQRQLDPPFLLSMSSGEVSRYINNLVDLSRIDEWTTAANSRERKLRQDIESLAERVDKATSEVERYSFLPSLEALSDKVTELDRRKKELGLESHELGVQVGEHLNHEIELQRIPDVEKAFRLLDEIAGLMSRRPVIERESVVLAHELDEHAEKADICTEPIDEVVEIVGQLERWTGIRKNISAGIEELGNSLSNHSLAKSNVEAAECELGPVLEILETMTCPLCGRKGMHEEGN